MTSSINKSGLEGDINLHRVTNKIDDSFIGIKIKNDRIDFYYPETFDIDDSTPESLRSDVLAILQTISIAKTHSSSKIKIESSFSNNEAIPLLSYLWIIRDYLVNGFYINKEKVYKTNQRGRVDWKRTINGQPIISKGNVIYKDIVVSVKNDLDDIIVEIHRYCVKKSIDILGWLFGIKNSSFIQVKPFYKGLKNVYIDSLQKELNNTFDDEKRARLKHMLAIVEGLSEDNNANELVYGVDSYAYIFERMINSIFGNREASKFNPSANWFLKSDQYSKEHPSSDLRPDTILIRDNIAYVLDSKFYRYGFTADVKDLPETTSIQKQITYGDFIKTNKMSAEIQKIRSAFILPYSKYNNKFNFKETIEYIGFSKTDYRKGTEDHEIIHAFLIDLRYVIETWNKKNHGNDVKTLIDQIEEIQRTKIKVEKENDFISSITHIREDQTFKAGILDSFYATLTNSKLVEALTNNQILFVDGFFVINDKKYIEIDENTSRKKLTKYAIKNMNECCLAFETREIADGEFQYEFCKDCVARKKKTTKSIRTADEHNSKIFLRAQDSDIDRVIEDNKEALELKSKLSGSFAYNLKYLMDECGFTSVNSLKKESTIDNHKIDALLDGSKLPTLKECVALCAVFELHPIVAHTFIGSASYNIQTPSCEEHAFYNFLINYCYGDSLDDWNLKISEANRLEWQIP